MSFIANITLLFLFLLGPRLSAETVVLPIKTELAALDIWNQSEYQVDTEGAMNLAQVLRSSDWKPTTDLASSLSYVKGALWIGTVLVNRSYESF
jgi:hypothetical protein